MNITFLGTRGNVDSSAPGYSQHSGILIDDVILLDVGENQFLDLCPQRIFISHLHPDHAAFAASDIRTGMLIYAPESSPRFPMLRVISGSVRAAGFTVTAVPTVHSHRVKSAGYIVEKRGKRVFYTSDLVSVKPGLKRLLQGLDVVITDGSFIRSKGLIRKDVKTGLVFGHNGLPDLVRFFSRFCRCIIVTHYGTWFFKDIARSRRKIESLGNGVRVIPAHDGMRFEVP